MAELGYVPEEFGWFKVSRRFVASSRWTRGSPEAIKLMIYCLEQASRPNNPYPGHLVECGDVLAARCSLTREQCDRAVGELLGEDPDSFGGSRGGAFLEPLTSEGRLVGYKVINFERYNPGVVETSAIRKSQKRKSRASKAAIVRWKKTCQFPECPRPAAVRIGGTGRFYCEEHAMDAPRERAGTAADAEVA